jgi:hypothetical protein
MDAAKPLNYAPKPTATHRARRWIIRVPLILIVCAIALYWIPAGIDGLRQFYWQRQCLTFTQPPAHIVWEVNGGMPVHQESCAPVINFMNVPALPSNAIIFSHELRSPDGSRWLLILSVTQSSRTAQFGNFQIYGEVGNLSIPPSRLCGNVYTVPPDTAVHLKRSHWKFFAGQPDPANLSHFTFAYDLDGQRHTCDGWLKNDATLVISQRP